MEKIEDQSFDLTVPRRSRDEDTDRATTPSLIPNAMPASQENSVKDMDSVVPVEEDHEYLEGFKLLITIFSLSCVGFLILLDVSIVTTVGWRSLHGPHLKLVMLIVDKKGNSKNH